MAQPTFSDDVNEAYNQMATQEGPNDFMVMKFEGDSMEMSILETGKGGIEKTRELLAACDDEIAIGIFRVTAVDDRGVT
eukprot:CAMPEP_0181329726 /NCGR_PEP_ID=MMETSP1101-20121128/23476_1 /TAXON_ID=46948 /ORGANISM="Rhodomonas abbreviata, Strain Caron Lab Isolate" /LENGTH=78 /DNA_ID=CAMNT_0023438847 /DNA_START=65 /DNA_END=298 /DNA_ORIENTATION=+